MRKKLSHEPVPTAIPLSVTPKQLTRLSWPASIPEMIVRSEVGFIVKGGRGGRNHTCSLSFHRIPHITVEIIVTG